jgi:hypothetical protein
MRFMVFSYLAIQMIRTSGLLVWSSIVSGSARATRVVR